MLMASFLTVSLKWYIMSILPLVLYIMAKPWQGMLWLWPRNSAKKLSVITGLFKYLLSIWTTVFDVVYWVLVHIHMVLALNHYWISHVTGTHTDWYRLWLPSLWRHNWVVWKILIFSPWMPTNLHMQLLLQLESSITLMDVLPMLS